MKRLCYKGLGLLIVSVVFFCCLSSTVFASVNAQLFTVYKDGSVVYNENVEIEVGQSYQFEIKENNNNTAQYSYDWSVDSGSKGTIQIEEGTSSDCTKVIITGIAVESLTGDGSVILNVNISEADGSAASIPISITVKDYRANVGLYYKDTSNVELKDTTDKSIVLTGESYKVEYRVFQAIYNLKDEYKIVLDTLQSSVSFIFDGKNIEPIAAEDFSKTVNFTVDISSLDRSQRNGLASAAAVYGVTSFDYQNHDYYVFNTSAAGTYPCTAAIQVDFDSIYNTIDREIATKILLGQMKMYIYDPELRTLIEGPELSLISQTSNTAIYETDKGAVYILTDKMSLTASSAVSESETVSVEPIPNTSGNEPAMAIILIAMLTFGFIIQVIKKAK